MREFMRIVEGAYTAALSTRFMNCLIDAPRG